MNKDRTRAAIVALFVSAATAAPAQEDREKIRAVDQAVHPSLVGIEITLRRKTRLEKADLQEETLDSEAQQLLALTENQQTLDTWGVAIEKDLVLMADRAIKAADIERIELTLVSGERFEARLHAVGRRHDFVLLKPAAPRELTPLAFGDWAPPALGEYFYITYVDRADDRWHVNVSPYIMTNAPLQREEQAWSCIDTIRPGSVVSDRTGTTVGVALDQYLWVRMDPHDPPRSSFLGKGILEDERLTDLDARFEGFRSALAGRFKRVEISFRAEKTEPFRPAEDSKSDRQTVSGVVLDDRGTLFVPQDVSRELIRKIEDIRIVDGARSVPVTFLGSFRSFGGLLLRAEGLPAGDGIALDAVPPPPGEIFFTVALEDRFGRSRLAFDYNRLFRTEKGIKGAPRLQPRKRIRTGSFLLDFDGRIIGCATTDRKEEDYDEVAAEASRERSYGDSYRSSYTPDYLRRLVLFGEIAAALADPAPHFDAKAVPMSKRDERRLVWLGVEFQEMSKPVAETLGIQDRELTDDGRRGLLITDVYAGSPAGRSGLCPEDVLLRLRPDGESSWRDLVAEPDRLAFARGNPYGPGPRGATPWRPTRNYLTTLLTEVGANRTVRIEYLRGTEKAGVDLVLEYAPTDYETAERHKDEQLGFTVKELTYDVRYYQRLERDAAGVVVAKVESGSKADVAKLAALSIIGRVNDVPVRDLVHFKELVAATRTLTLTTVSTGQTRLVELSRD
jgi:S1-C subfamily serine protease